MAKHLISSDRSIQAMKPSVRRLNDGAGLHLRHRDSSKHWYQEYSYDRVRCALSLGSYPEISLAEARRRSHQMREEVALGINPAKKRKAEANIRRERQEARRLLGRQDAQPGSFEHIARSWLEIRRHCWSDEHARTAQVRLTKHVFPVLGQRPISEVHPTEFTSLFMKIDAAGTTNTAGRVHELCRRICDFALATGHLKANPCPDAKEVLRTAVMKHHAAITDPERLAEFLKAVDQYNGSFVVTCAIKVVMRTFLRSREFRWARWSEFDLDRQVWTVPAERMKGTQEKKLNGEPHMVPLSSQTVEILRQLHQVTGREPYVFAGQGSKKPVISDNTINKAIRAMGYSTRHQQTLHGFRATARTMLVERLGWHKDIVELQLDHQVSDLNGHAYNRVELDQSRSEMMGSWSDYLDQLQAGVVPTDARHHSFPPIQACRVHPTFAQTPTSPCNWARIQESGVANTSGAS